MLCMLLVLLHGVNRNPQDLDIFTKSVLLQQVGIALQCSVSNMQAVFSGLLQLRSVLICVSWDATCANWYHIVFLLCMCSYYLAQRVNCMPPRLSVRGLQLHNLFTSNAIRMQPYQLTNRKYHTVEKSSMIVGL